MQIMTTAALAGAFAGFSSAAAITGLSGVAAVTALAGISTATAQTIEVGRNVHVSAAHADRPHYEVHLAADADRAERLVGGTMVWTPATNRYSVAAYTSHDGGVTWAHTLEVDLGSYAADPAAAFGADGSALLTFFGADAAGATRMWFYRAPDGGLRWPEPQQTPLFDRQYVTVDRTGGRFHGRVYVHGTATGRRLDAGGPAIGVGITRAEDGRNFEAPLFLAATPPAYVRGMGNGAVLADGTFAFVYGEWLDAAFTDADDPLATAPTARIRVAASTTGGESFRPGVTVDDAWLRAGGATTSMPAIAVDASDGPFRDRLYVVWSDYRNGRSEPVLSWSADGGRTWSRPRPVHDDRRAELRGRGADHFMASVAVNREGVVGVMWYDRREHADNLGWHVRFAASYDGGDTFTPSVRVSEGDFDFAREAGHVVWGQGGSNADGTLRIAAGLHHFNDKGGDTANLVAAADGRFHVFWIDNRTGVPQIWTAAATAHGAAQRYGDPELAALRDVTNDATFEIANVRWDPGTRTVAMDVRVRNRSADVLRGPLYARVIELGSLFGVPVLLDADRGGSGTGSIIEFALPTGGLVQGARSEPRTIHARLDGAESLRPPPGARPRGGAFEMVRLNVRLFGS
jgi:hypothetical protein